jgi:hypothetical protein
MVTVQLPKPGQEKPGSELVHPANASAAFGVSLKMTVGAAKGDVWDAHALLQLMPAGLLVTVP